MAATAYNPAKSPGEMTAGEINKALDRLDKLDSQLTREFIEAGRGNERPSDWADKHDPLTERWRAMYRERMDLRNEAERRYGPGVPSRLPKGFGPMRRNPTEGPASWVVVSKATGEAVFETFQKKLVDKVNLEKYDVMPIHDYLIFVNKKIKAGNPAVSSEQYRLAQAVLSGTARETGMTKKVAREIVEKTPARMRSEFMRENPDDSPRNWPVFTTFPDTQAGAKEAKAIALKLKINGVLNRCELEGGVNQEWVVRVQALQKGKAWGVIEGRRSNPNDLPTFVASTDFKITRDGHSTAVKAGSVWEALRPLGAEIVGGETRRYWHLGERKGNKWGSRQIKMPLEEVDKFLYKGVGRKSNPEDSAASMFESFHGEPSEEVLEFAEEEAYHGNLAALGILVELLVITTSGYEATVCFDVGDEADYSSENSFFGSLFGKHTSHASDRLGPENKVRRSRVGSKTKDGDVLYKGFQIRKTEDGEFKVPKIDTGAFKKLSDAKEFVDYYKLGARAKNPSDIPSVTLLCSNEDGNALYCIGGDQALNLKALHMSGEKWERDSMIIGDIQNVTYRTRKDFDKFKLIDYTHDFSEDSGGPLPVLRYDTKNLRCFIDGGSYKIKCPLLGTSPGIED